MARLYVVAVLWSAVGAVAAAQDAPNGPPVWSGEGSVNAGTTSGNTETTDIGVSLDLSRDGGLWTHAVSFLVDYGETSGEETKNRTFAAYQISRDFNARLFSFGRVSYEVDEFSGFDSRAFLGAGVGYIAVETPQSLWKLEGGPGFRRDELASGLTEDSVSARASSDFSYSFNESVGFTNVTEANYAEVSTQVSNIAAITASLTERISARASFEVRHETDPLDDREATDTATRLSIVFGF